MYFNEEFGYKRNPIIFSDDDIYVNYDKWESGECNSILVIGLSGSGKSTLGKKLAEQYNAYYIEIDIISFKIFRPKRANWLYIKKNDKYLYQYFKENNIPPTVMIDNFSILFDIRKNKQLITPYIHWLCFERPDLDVNKIIIEGGDIANAIEQDDSLINIPIIFKGTSLFTSIIRRYLRSAPEDGYLYTLKMALQKVYSQYSKMYPEINKARKIVMDNKEYKYVNEN